MKIVPKKASKAQARIDSFFAPPCFFSFFPRTINSSKPNFLAYLKMFLSETISALSFVNSPSLYSGKLLYKKSLTASFKTASP